MHVQKAYLLIFFTLWCQIDGVLLPPLPNLQSAPLTDDDDQYVSLERQQTLKGSSSFQKFRPVGLNPKTWDFLFRSASKELPSNWKLAGHTLLSSLYAFMSLQL